jgi:hypothetical protein
MASKAFLQQAYLAYFGRPADVSGLAFYADQSEAQVKAAFSASPESQAFFGSMAVANQINTIYRNLFNRDAEPAGLTYWSQEIGSGRLSLADAAMGILAGAQNDDKVAVTNKLAASAAFTTALDTTAEILGYAGSAAVTPARAFLAAVDATAASLTAATAGVAAAVVSVTTAGSAVAGQTFMLTAGVDVISGTAGNDTTNAVLQAAGATGTTVAPGDVINGGAGTDTLTIAVAGDLTADYTLSAVQTNSVEKVLLNNFDTHATRNNTVDTALMSGLSSIGLSASAAEGDTTFSNMTAIVGAEMRNGAADLTLTYGTAAVAGTADTQALTVSNISAGTFTANGAETIAITTELVKSSLTNVASNTLKTVTAAGAVDLTIGTALTATTINAAAMTGALNVKLGAADQAVTGGAGADVIDAATSLSSADTIVGGAGTDTLKVSISAATAVGTAASKGALYGVSGVEVIDIASTADTAVLDLDNTVGVTSVAAAANVKSVTISTAPGTTTETISFVLNGTTYTTAAVGANTIDASGEKIAAAINLISGFSAVAGAGAATTDKVTITSLTGEAIEIGSFTESASTTSTYTISAYSDVSFTNLTGQAVDVFSADAVTASLKDASGTADSLSINLKTVEADKGFNQSIGTVTANNIETINLGVTGMSDGKVKTVAALTGNAVKTLNITGNSDLTISAFTSSTALTTIDGSTATGDLNLAAAPAAKDQSIKTGSGNDTIVMGTLLTAADTIDGGANSVIAGGTTVGKDLLTASGNIGTVTTASALKIANVENIEIATGGAAATYIDAAGITGAENIAFSSTSGTVALTNLAATTKVGLGIGAGESANTFEIALADATGAADSITIDYSDAIDASTSNTLKIAAAVETLNISASKVATGTLTSTLVNTDMAAKNIVVTDGADVGGILALGTLNAATTNINASAYAGRLTATTAATGAVTVSANGKVVNDITTGAGADTITLAGALGTTRQVIDGKAGNDILNVSIDAADSDFLSVSGIETINITVGANKQATVANTTNAMTGINSAKNINLLGGDSLSSFANGTTGLLTDAEKTIDASKFGGAINLVLAVNALDADMTIIGGAATTDKVTTSISTDTTGEVVKSMTGVETLVINSATTDQNARIDLTNVSGLKTLETTFITGAQSSQIAVDKLMSGVNVKVVSTVSGDNLVVDLTDKAAADNALSLELTTFTTAGDTLNFDAAGVETLNINAKNTTAGLIDLGGVAATATTGTVTVNVTGTGGLTLKALSSLTNVVNASTATGAIVLASGDRAATAMTVTTGTGGDTVAMRHANDVLNGGLGTDTLTINANLVLGGIQVDLSSTTDEVTSFNGSANAAVQVGFENVDLSGITGTFGADITAVSTGSTITGTANGDQITGGAGADSVIATAGNDAVSLLGGNDTLTMTDAQFDDVSLASNGTYDFGAGTGDTLKISNALTGVDADFVDFTNVEILQITTDASTLTAGANLIAAGIKTIDSTSATFALTTSALGTAAVPFNLIGWASAAAETITFGGTAAAAATAITGWTVGTGATAGIYSKSGATVADFYTAIAGASNTAGVVAAFVDGGNTYLFAEGANTAATDDSYVVLVGVAATGVATTAGAGLVLIA